MLWFQLEKVQVFLPVGPTSPTRPSDRSGTSSRGLETPTRPLPPPASPSPHPPPCMCTRTLTMLTLTMAGHCTAMTLPKVTIGGGHQVIRTWFRSPPNWNMSLPTECRSSAKVRLWGSFLCVISFYIHLYMYLSHCVYLQGKFVYYLD